MARVRFKKPKIAVLMSEVISLTIWLFLGSRVITVLEGIVGQGGNGTAGTENNVSGLIFEDSWEILGIGCIPPAVTDTGICDDNTDDGLLGVIGLVMVVMILMNFISYN